MTPRAWIWCLLLAMASLESTMGLASFKPIPRNCRSLSRKTGLAAHRMTPQMDQNHVDRRPQPFTPLEATTRRSLFRQCATSTAASLVVTTTIASNPSLALAAQQADCYTDCVQNCRALAPKDTAYCQESCRDYCDQTDRQDGLSGSIGAAQGEVGILGGTFGTGTVVKGADKPPTIVLPGLDFTSSAGKKLIGY
jgi:hypothetical protein